MTDVVPGRTRIPRVRASRSDSESAAASPSTSRSGETTRPIAQPPAGGIPNPSPDGVAPASTPGPLNN